MVLEAGFDLDGLGGERLTLLKIVLSHLSTTNFSVLSAFQTFEVTEGSIIDGALHLAAAVFRSVVRTMVDVVG